METKECSIALFASWNLTRVGSSLYIPTTHYIYLDFVSKLYKKIYLISPVLETSSGLSGKEITQDNVIILNLPYGGSYLKSIKYYKIYYNTIKKAVNLVDLFYCRVPGPYVWLPALLFKKQTIMHFVGDTIDATRHNEKWSWLKKKLMIAGYLPDYWLTLKAAKKSTVFTNGPHLAERLAHHRIKATPVISSTISEKDLHDDFTPLPVNADKVTITYIGYVRFAMGMNCLMAFCKRMHEAGIKYHFNLVGSGEMFDDVRAFIESERLSEYVSMHGHISDKAKMNSILRQSDLFFFPSLSEGSPRVIIEAMAQGVPVVSTPVGSLPSTFKEGETIRFFDYNDVEKAMSIVKEYLNDSTPFDKQRCSAYEIVTKQFTIEHFLPKVFTL